MFSLDRPLAINPDGLTDDEHNTVMQLVRKMFEARQYLDLHEAYYDGSHVVTDLGVSIPPQLNGLHTVLGWPRLGVDVLAERLVPLGFRYPSSDDADLELHDIWQANGLDQEAGLAHLDALIYGRAYAVVGPGEDYPLITVESPTNLAVNWDVRTRKISEALQAYSLDGSQAAALYLPGRTIHMVRQRDDQWVIADRDEHGMPFPPVVMLANRQRSNDRYGRSEITPEVMSVTDAACRTMLGMEVAREFYSAPQRYILGATEEAFQDSDGNPKTAWETYLGRVLALERDEEGNLPEVGQFQTYNPAVYTQILDMYSQMMGGLLAVPAEFLGRTTENPSSADAIRMSTDRLVRRAKARQVAFEGGWEEVMRIAVLMNGDSLPSDAHLLETIWADPNIPTPMATAQSILWQVEAGAIPGESDVTREALGWSPVQRRRLEVDQRRADAKLAAQQIREGLSGNNAGGPSAAGRQQRGAAQGGSGSSGSSSS